MTNETVTEPSVIPAGTEDGHAAYLRDLYQTQPGLERIRIDHRREMQLNDLAEKITPPVGVAQRGAFVHLGKLLALIAGRDLTEHELGELRGIAYMLDDLDICTVCQCRRKPKCDNCGTPK